MDWTSHQIPDQKGRNIIVTGANSGLGLEISYRLANKRAHVIMACRNEDAGKKAAEKIYSRCNAANLTVLRLDLSDLDSINKFVKQYSGIYTKLDILINNAGTMVPPFSRTKQGFELQFGTNHLGHFALTGRLMPIILNTPQSRVVSVSSLGSRIGHIDFDDLNYEHKKYRPWFAYGQSKLANLTFIIELARKLKANRANTIAVAAHPGGSPTNLQRNSGYFMKHVLTPLLAKSSEMAALPTLRAATDLSVTNGSYWGPSGLFGLKGYPILTSMQSSALNVDLGRKLWKVSEELTQIEFKL